MNKRQKENIAILRNQYAVFSESLDHPYWFSDPGKNFAALPSQLITRTIKSVNNLKKSHGIDLSRTRYSWYSEENGKIYACPAMCYLIPFIGFPPPGIGYVSSERFKRRHVRLMLSTVNLLFFGDLFAALDGLPFPMVGHKFLHSYTSTFGRQFEWHFERDVRKRFVKMKEFSKKLAKMGL